MGQSQAAGRSYSCHRMRGSSGPHQAGRSEAKKSPSLLLVPPPSGARPLHRGPPGLRPRAASLGSIHYLDFPSRAPWRPHRGPLGPSSDSVVQQCHLQPGTGEPALDTGGGREAHWEGLTCAKGTAPGRWVDAASGGPEGGPKGPSQVGAQPRAKGAAQQPPSPKEPCSTSLGNRPTHSGRGTSSLAPTLWPENRYHGS